MSSRQALAQVIDLILEHEPKIEPNIIEEYKKLEEDCKKVLNKIKKRKQHGE
jgi:hypothetical protein